MPYFLVDNPFGYICAMGDVQGNLVSYYCARQNISSDNYLNQLTIKEIDDSIFTMLRMEKATIYDWNLGIHEPKLAAFYATFEGKVLVDYVEEIEFRQEIRVK